MKRLMIKKAVRRGKIETAGILLFERLLLKAYNLDCVNGDYPADAEIVRLMREIPRQRISRAEQRMLDDWLTKFAPILNGGT